MKCQCERCENNKDGYCLNAMYVELDENGVCTDMYIKLENEENTSNKEHEMTSIFEVKDVIPPCNKCRHWIVCCNGCHFPNRGVLKKRIYNLFALGEDCYTIPSGYDN